MNGGGGRRVLGPRPVNGRKGGDEDLLLFKELQRRDKDRIVCLLQPVSDDFEPNHGNLSFYRMSSGKRGSGFEFTAEADKNDYDWLKTPPATPLFQSLDMEANAPDLILQRELPITQPVSRFASNPEATNASNVARPKSANPKPKPLARPITPIVNQIAAHNLNTTANPENVVGSMPTRNQNNDDDNKRPTTSDSSKTSRWSSQQQPTNQKSTALTVDHTKRTQTPKPTTQPNFLASNLNKTTNGPLIEPKPRPRSRGVSPQVIRRPITAPPQDQSPPSDQRPPVIVLSNETPPNLRTDRSLSAARGRPAIKPSIGTTPSTAPDRATSANRTRPAANTTITSQKHEAVGNKAVRRQSCSPSVTRGRKAETNKPEAIGTNIGAGQVFGSKMVDKFMNARKSAAVNHEKKQIVRTVNDGSGGFGRFTSKSSLDTAIKHMDIKRDRFGPRQLGKTLDARDS